MTKPLQAASIAAPGFYGLNTQESSITLDSGFALQATNCVIDKFGRLGARKGWVFLDEVEDANLLGMHRFVDIDATEYFGTWSDDTFYIYSSGTLSEVTYAGSQTITAGNWQAVTLNDKAFLFQVNYEPLYFDTVSGAVKDMSQAVSTATVTITSNSTTATVTHTAHGFTTGDQVTISGANEAVFNGTFTITVTGANTYTYTMPNSNSNNPATGTITVAWYHDVPPQANVALSAYGRVWAASTSTNKTTLYWSDLLDGTDWSSGTAGSLDISGILVYGNDEIVALGAHNGFLIVFCKNNIIIFGDSDGAQQYLDPTTLQLVEVINGVGCVARDSVQNTGTDILFLSDSGLMSLGRVIQEKSTPMRDLSKNVRDDLVQALAGETPANIKSAYSPSNAFYLLAFPTTQQVYCFDMRAPLQDGSARVTTWNNMDFTSWLAFDGEIYMTHNDGLARYLGYQDNGQSYRMVYFTNYFDLGNSAQTKMLKRLTMTVIGATGQDFIVKSSFDYTDQYNSYPLSVRQGTLYEYGANAPAATIGKYGLTTTTSSVSQTSTTVTDADGDHYEVDFQTTQDGTYNVPFTVWLDTDTYYYIEDDGSRTETTLYVKAADFASEYSGGTLVDTVRTPASGSGSVLQLGFEADLNGGALSVQKMDIYVKQGRIL